MILYRSLLFIATTMNDNYSLCISCFACIQEQRVNFYCRKADYEQLHSEAEELLSCLGYQHHSISNVSG